MLNNPHQRALDQYLDGLNLREAMTLLHIVELSKKRVLLINSPMRALVVALWPLAWLGLIHFAASESNAISSDLYRFVQAICIIGTLFEFLKVFLFRMWKEDFWHLVSLAQQLKPANKVR